MILIFAGAGASFAIDRSQYPTTRGFFERLPPDILRSPLFIQIVRFLAKQKQLTEPDIEHVLWELGELHTFFEKVANPKEISGWFSAHHAWREIVPANRFNVGDVAGMSTYMSAQCSDLISQVNKQVFSLYSATPSAESLEGTWKALLDPVLAEMFRVELVSTNYDLVIENAIDRFSYPIDLGRINGAEPYIDTTRWENLSLPENIKGRLTKLHGSVDWIKSDESEGARKLHFGVKRWTGNHADRAIIYPGFKGIPEFPPLRRKHRYFQECVKVVEAIVFIGFAFRDTYINDLLLNNLARSARVYVLDPGPLPKHLPVSLSNLVHIQKGFVEGVSELVERLLESK